MPESLPRSRVERDEAVGKQVVSRPVTTEEIEARCAKGNERDSVLQIDGQFTPVVNAARFLVSPFRPRVVTEFTRMRNAVEDPHDLAGPYVVGLDIGGRRVVTGTLCR